MNLEQLSVKYQKEIEEKGLHTADGVNKAGVMTYLNLVTDIQNVLEVLVWACQFKKFVKAHDEARGIVHHASMPVQKKLMQAILDLECLS